jgi:hypothetical protein
MQDYMISYDDDKEDFYNNDWYNGSWLI